MKAVVSHSETCSFITAPPSKSAAHRAIIMAALAEGTSRITNFTPCDDTLATLAAVRELGAGWYIAESEPKTLYVFGAGVDSRRLRNKQAYAKIFCGKSASTLRFLLPVMCALFESVSFVCDPQLFSRPMQVYEQLCPEGGYFERDEESYTFNVSGTLPLERACLDGSISSQFLSGLLLCAPLLGYDSELLVKNEPASKPYVEQTLFMQELFQVSCGFDGKRHFSVSGNQRYRCANIRIEADYSNSAVFMVLGALADGLDIVGIDAESRAPDAQIIDILRMANVSVRETAFGIHIEKSTIYPFVADCADCPDLAMLLCVLAAFASGEYSLIKNIGRLRFKEIDRAEGIVYELRKAGVNIGLIDDDLAIYGGSLSGGGEFDSHGDHRLAMACAVLAACVSGKSVIGGAEAVDKSYPDFWHDLRCVGVEVELTD